MREKVLFVDDEVPILNAVERVFADDGVGILKATSAEEALRIMRGEEVAVIVSDNRMPGITGIELLAGLGELSPHTVKILMTGYADLQTAVDAINSGGVFRIIIKPWEERALVKTVTEGVTRYRVGCSLQRGDEATLRSLAQAIELKDPYTRGHCDRVARYALMIAEELGLPEEVKRQIKQGSWLHDCGKIGVPESLLNFKGPLNDSEFATMKQHAVWGAEVARQAGLSEMVVNIILHHHERYDGEGYPAGLRGETIPLEARIAMVADVYDALTSKRSYRKAYRWQKALGILTALAGSHLDPGLTRIFIAVILRLSGQENRCGGKE